MKVSKLLQMFYPKNIKGFDGMRDRRVEEEVKKQ